MVESSEGILGEKHERKVSKTSDNTVTYQRKAPGSPVWERWEGAHVFPADVTGECGHHENGTGKAQGASGPSEP